ncbi:ComEC/Rec2 family competence protein [Oceaniglobus ichthyenteri]|uniref:ComEC/Rec2 family competence protein n=1 Tax=Oceaniglobus ichthyenteri TaxID=2136177 RepID=UPI001F0C1747|nr:ComEC/Rec2 family competence protein [Oceaniglobus ichthyenteri]
MTPVVEWVNTVIDRQRGALFPWVPVCMGIGIGVYFSLMREPDLRIWGAIVVCALLLGGVAFRHGVTTRPIALALFLVLVGFLMAGVRTYLVAEAQLTFRYYGPVEGRIVAIDRSGSDRVRLTLDHVVLEDMRPERVPFRVRISLQPDVVGTVPIPGKRVAITAHLSPPGGPVEPGGFDFQRMAWFKRIGAVGYARTPLIALAPASTTPNVARWRTAIAREVRAKLPGEAGAFAVAITTGDRSGMARSTLTALRESNLAHLLAISGLHMGLLTTFVFGVLRTLMVLIPAVALGWPVKKIAAGGALMAGAVYLALSGGNVATQRAFIMVSVILVAVILDRRALTLRAVAVAAMIVLILRPESLTEPGFQMSFAATIALVAVFRVVRDFQSERIPRWAKPVFATVISSAVAGAATAPVAAAHFNMLAHYGLLANLLSVPLMGLIVMPGAVLAACLAPFGLHGIGLAIMEPPIRWIMAVAHWTAAQDGAVGRVVSPGPWVIPMFAMGMLWLVLWRGRVRFAGVLPAICAFALWSVAQRPAVLISPSGGLIGVMQNGVRVLNKPKGEGFAAVSWLENDGDTPDQAKAAARSGTNKPILTFTVGEQKIAYLAGRGAADRIAEGCAIADTVILAAVSERPTPTGCTLWDREKLNTAGGISLTPGAGGFHSVSARTVAGVRPWNRDQ